MDKPHPDAFITSYDPIRGYREWMLLEPLPDGRMRSKTWREQITPHRFFDQNREIGDMQCRTGNTQDHWRHVSRIPHAVWNEWVEKYGNPISDEDANKKWTQLLNSREFHKLRTHDGQL